MKLLLHRGVGPVAAGIRWQTDGPFTHVSILFDDGQLIEAREGKGVVETPLEDVRRAIGRNPGLSVQVFDFKQPLDPALEWPAQNFANEQRGKGYDWLAIARFVTRGRSGPREGLWFCSELGFVVAQKRGVTLLERIEPWRVDPSRLSHSPLIVPRYTLAPLK